MEKFWRGHKNCSVWMLPAQAEILRRAAALRGVSKAALVNLAICQILSQEEREAWIEADIEDKCAKAGVSRT
jgi:hypothetical protein